MTMLFIRSLQAFDGFQMVEFGRMRVYTLPDDLSKDLIAAGYASEFNKLNKHEVKP